MPKATIPITPYNDTWAWVGKVEKWAVANCPSFSRESSLQSYVYLELSPAQYRFDFDDKHDATFFLLRWL